MIREFSYNCYPVKGPLKVLSFHPTEMPFEKIFMDLKQLNFPPDKQNKLNQTLQNNESMTLG